MKCCQKTNVRDCDCLRPRGSCQKPQNIFTHYDRQCACYSCEWIRAAMQEYIPDRLGSGSNPSGTVPNCAYAGNRLDEVVNSGNSQKPNDLELVHPIMVAEGPPVIWGWSFRSTRQLQLPYLASGYRCPATVMMTTLDSKGRWKALGHDLEEPFPLVHKLPPQRNILYRDHGYSPSYHPYARSAVDPRPSDNMACTPDGMKPPNKLRRYAADDSNSTLAVGSIDKSVSEEDLRFLFECYGQIRYINRPDQTCAFIQFALRRDAMMAMRQLQGVPINRNRFRIAWGDPKVRKPDEFEVREGPLRLKGNRYQKPPKPWDMVQIGRPQYPFHYPQQSQVPVYQWPFGGGLVWRHVLPHGQVPAQQQMGYAFPPQGFYGLPRINEDAEPEGEQAEPPLRLDPRAASFTSAPERKGPLAVYSSYETDPSGQLHNTQLQSAPSTSLGGSNPGSFSSRATAASSISGRTSLEDESGPNERAASEMGMREAKKSVRRVASCFF